VPVTKKAKGTNSISELTLEASSLSIKFGLLSKKEAEAMNKTHNSQKARKA